MKLQLTASLLLALVRLASAAQTPPSAAPAPSAVSPAAQQPLSADQKHLVGQWQGTVQTPQPLRVVLKVTADAGKLRAFLIAIDQSPDYIAATDISASPEGVVKFSVAMVQGSYQGKMSAEGQDIDGTWTQGASFKLDLHRATPESSWLTKSTTQSIEVAPNVSLEVIDWGGSGPPLVFLAGMGNTAHVFDTFAPKFVPAYHAYGITRRGFGASSSPTPSVANYRAEQLGDDVLKVIDVLRLNKPVLVGHSIAGEELSSVGSRHPASIGGLIYLDAGYPYALYSPEAGDTRFDAEEVKANLDAFLAHRAGADPSRLLDDLIAQMPRLEKDLETEKKRQDLLPSMPPGQPASAPPALTVPDAITKGEQKYTDIQVPLLAIFASPHNAANLPPMPADKKASFLALDQAKSAAQAKAFEQLKSAKVALLPNADHYVFFSNEQEVEKLMKEFLTSLEKTQPSA